MVKLIVAAALVVVITSSSAIAGIMLTHAAFARTPQSMPACWWTRPKLPSGRQSTPVLRLVRPEQTQSVPPPV